MFFRWDYVAALRFPWPCATGDLTTERRAAACGPGLLLSLPPPYGRKRPTDEDKKTAPDIHRARLSVVIRLGFEPKTHSLEGCCSIQLSYRTDPYVALLVLPWESKADAKITLFLQKHKIIFPKALPLLFSRFFRWPYF